MTEYGDILRVCGGAVIALVCVLVLRAGDRGHGMGNAAVLGFSVLLTVGAFTAAIPVFTTLRGWAEEYLPDTVLSGGQADILRRALAVGVTVQLTSDGIRDAGEPALADKLDLAGRAALLAVGMPLIGELLSLAKSFLAL